jgi:polar amino acid transport system substrate-binding protein
LRHRTRLVALAVTLPLALAACGGSSSSSSATSSAPAAGGAGDPAMAGRVPAAIRSDGVITVGTDSTYAPSEFLDTDGKTVIGFDVDVFTAVAAKLGLKARFVTAPFDAIIPGVNSGKYEIGVSSFTVNPERKQAVDMVSYFNAGTQWAAKKGGAAVSPDDACGKKIAVQKGTVQVDDITARDKKCTGAGKSSITIDQYQGQDEATAAVVSGKDAAMLADSPVIAYAVKKANGQLESLGDIYDAAPYGYVVSKTQDAFAQVLVDALKAVQQDGSYTKALEKWGVQQGALTSPALNP